MATSVVYASIMAGVMASLRSLRTSLVAYSTDVVDLTEALADPVDVIFGTQLGGGTNTSPALEYCRRTITRPSAAVLVLISDLYDFSPERMLEHVARIQGDGVQVVVLLALSDDGLPSYNHKVAASLGAMGVPAFGCTPDAFPGLIAAAIQGDDLGRWAEQQASQ
jgi:von willebrand factor, type A